jgi:hypothetical protein
VGNRDILLFCGDKGATFTSAFTWNGHIIIPSGEIKAGVPTPVVMSGKIYFN